MTSLVSFRETLKSFRFPWNKLQGTHRGLTQRPLRH